MSNNTKISIRFFDDREVRAVWDEENSRYPINLILNKIKRPANLISPVVFNFTIKIKVFHRIIQQ